MRAIKASLSLTHNCNLRCRYCYGGRKFKKDMSFATVQKVVDFIFRVSPPEQKISFTFFGGEPFLCFDLIQRAVEYINNQVRARDRLVDFSITSNGTLLSEEILDFLNKENITLCISIDGTRHVHNKYRRFPDGRGSFDDVVEKLHLSLRKLGEVQVNTVYSPDTLDSLSECVSFFTQLGISSIHLNPNIRASWTKQVLPRFRKTYRKIADLYIEKYQQSQEIAVNLIDSKIILFLKGGYFALDRCMMGETEWGFAPSGNIYPCERLIGEDDGQLCLGNVHSGLNKKLQCELIGNREIQNEECRSCSLRKYCMNSCGCTNFHMTGSPNLTSSTMCASEKAAIDAAKQVLLSLKENDLFIDHFMQYLHEEQIQPFTSMV
ncbi:MAG: radical SAM protein [Promethearchaeota archaeon]